MTLDSNILECHVTSISHNIWKEPKVLSRIQTGAEKQIFAVLYSIKDGSVQPVFNLELTLIFPYS